MFRDISCWQVLNRPAPSLLFYLPEKLFVNDDAFIGFAAQFVGKALHPIEEPDLNAFMSGQVERRKKIAVTRDDRCMRNLSFDTQLCEVQPQQQVNTLLL